MLLDDETPRALPVYDVPLRAVPKADCPECGGTGFRKDPETRRRLECECVLRQRLDHYLTPMYRDARYFSGFEPYYARVAGRNVAVDGVSVGAFKTFTKTFLISSGMSIRHATMSAQNILQAYLNEKNEKGWTYCVNLDLLILYLVEDPYNGHYANIMISLITQRQREGRPTWVVSPMKFQSPEFLKLYLQQFVDFISDRKSTTGTFASLPVSLG